MDKEFIIALIKEVKDNQLSIDKVTKLLIEYCVVEYNKPVKETNIFVSTLLSNPIMLPSYIDVALDYYKKKLNIGEVYSKDGKLLLTF